MTDHPAIGVRELRADLAAHLRRAGAGQRVVVTVGGRQVAQLGPVHSIDGQTVLADLVTAGLVVAPRRTDRARPAQAIPVWSGVRLDRALKELRG
jgi:antitoxin (DNA-binding transcriptional repressor) of toxin-antitoxin stability system